MTRKDARSLISAGQKLSYVLNLKLEHPASAQAFIDDRLGHDIVAPITLDTPPIFLESWQNLRYADEKLVRNEQRALLTGSWLLALLALASITVLVGGRMRRVLQIDDVSRLPEIVARAWTTAWLSVGLTCGVRQPQSAVAQTRLTARAERRVRADMGRQLPPRPAGG